VIHILDEPNNYMIMNISNYTSVEVQFGGELRHRFRSSYPSSVPVRINGLSEFGEYEIVSDGTFISCFSFFKEIQQTHRDYL